MSLVVAVAAWVRGHDRVLTLVLTGVVVGSLFEIQGANRIAVWAASSVVFSGDGRIIAVAAEEHLHLWNVSTGDHITGREPR